MASSSSYRHAATASASVPQARLSHLLLLFALCLLLVAIPAQAAQKSILLLSSGSAKVYQRVSSSIGASLQRLCSSADRPGCAEYRILESTLDGDDTETSTDATRWNLVVTIGVKAANHANKRFPAAARLYTLIPKSSTADLGLESAAGSASAIYLDQPITRQLNLIKLAMAGDIRIGALGDVDGDGIAAVVARVTAAVLESAAHRGHIRQGDDLVA